MSKIKRAVALQLQVGSGLEVNNPPAINTSMVRSDTIFGDIQKANQGLIDIEREFERKTAITLEDYLGNIFGLLAYYITQDVRKLIEEPGLACIRYPTFFGGGAERPC